MHDLALNEADEMVFAENAVSGKVYFCMSCHCQMYKTCRNTHYFARVPGHKHTKISCDRIESNKKVRKMGLTMRDKFHAWLMTEPRPGTGGGGGSKGGKGGGGDGGPLIRALPYRSLGDLYVNSLHKCDNMNIGDGMLTDLLISNKTSGCVMMSNEALGPRALQVKIDRKFEDKNVIRFVLCDNDASRKKKVFDMIFEDKEAYQNWVDQLFVSYVDAEGLTQSDVKYKFVLIHGDWCEMPIDACKTICKKRCAGQWTCTGYQYSFYAGKRQIFCPADQKAKR